MFLAIALSLSATQFAQAKVEIGRWCAANQPAEQERCIGEQIDGLKRFRSTARYYGYTTVSAQAANTCLTRSAREPSLDWKAAATCLSNRQSFDSTSWQREPPRSPPLTPYPNWRGLTPR